MKGANAGARMLLSSAAPYPGTRQPGETAAGARGVAHDLCRSRGFPRVADAALQRFGAHRTRRREQKALAEADVVVEQIDHRTFVLDTLGNEIDAVAAEQIGEVGGVDVVRNHADPVEQ